MISHTLTIYGLDGDAIDQAMIKALRSRGYAVQKMEMQMRAVECTAHKSGSRREAATTILFPDGTPLEDSKVHGEKWETLRALAARLGLRTNAICRDMTYEHCPRPRAERRGPKGRLLGLVSSEEFEGFLTRNKKVTRARRPCSVKSDPSPSV